MKWTPKVGQKTFGIHFMIVILAIWSVLRTEKLNKICIKIKQNKFLYKFLFNFSAVRPIKNK